MSNAQAALERFSAPTRDVVRGGVRRADPGAGRRLGRDRAGAARARGRADRLGQDALGVPLGHRPAADRAGRPDRGRHARSSTSPRSRPSRSTSSATCASPLVGIRQTAERLGARLPEVSVGIRSGDTPAAERRTLARTPPDILITTPESLFLMLTSQARESLRHVETVIVDEVHAVAGTKRGAHLGLSLERLDALLTEAGPADRPVRHRAAARGGRALPRGHARRSRSSRRRRSSSGTSRSSSRSRT